jgi:Domain of unknown function (DUF4328)
MSTLAGDFWVCGDCRSINNAGARQCYNCRTPRDRAAVDPTTIDPSSHGPLRTIELPAFASSRWAAIVATVLILAVAVMQIVQYNLRAQLVAQTSAGTPATQEQVSYVGSIDILAVGIGLLALIAWALWLSRTVRAMPALGLGYPPTDGMMAFVENFVPVLNLYRVPAIVRDVVRRLEPKTGGDETMTRGEALVFAAWIGIIGGFFIPRVLRFLAGDERALISISGIGTGFVLIGAIFLVILIWWIEGKVLQRRQAQLAGVPPTAGATRGPGVAAGAGGSVPETAVAASALDAVRNRSAFTAFASGADDPIRSFRLPPTEDASPVALDAVPTESGAEEGPVGGMEPTMPDAAASVERASPVEATRQSPPEGEPLVEAKAEVASAPAHTEDPAPAPDPPPTPAGPPDLTIRVSTRGLMTAELDGEVEHVMLDDLGPYAEALSHVGGTATIHLPVDEGMPALIGKRAQRILEDAGVHVSFR